MKKSHLYLFLIVGSLLIDSCTRNSDEAIYHTEGDDTPIEVISYTDLGNDPYFLEEGDKIAIISASSLPSQEQFEATMKGLEEWGYVPIAGKYVLSEDRSLADCIEDVTWALRDPEIKAIYSVRGGSASSEVMDQLPMALIKEANKPIIGYSDITVYHSAWTRNGLPSIHSSMSATFMDLPQECAGIQRKMMTGQIPSYKVQGSGYDRKGSAEGILIGGNLATLTAVLATVYDCTEIDQPYILFLEDVDENFAHIQLFLMILDHNGALDKASGLIFGEWVDYPDSNESYNGNSRGGAFTSVADMINRQFIDDMTIPVAFGFPAGHGENNYPLLMGVKVKLDVSEDSYTLKWQ